MIKKKQNMADVIKDVPSFLSTRYNPHKHINYTWIKTTE